MGARLSSSTMSSTTRPTLIHPPQHPPPSHSSIASFISSLLPQPPKSTDVSFHYHSPRSPAALTPTSHVVLSVTPTPGFYTALHHPNASPTFGKPLAFLHRPWTLIRYDVPWRSTVLSSHTGFDEVLTVGWNTALARRLELNEAEAICITGYKGDAERKIGLVAGFMGEMALAKDVVIERIQREFWDPHNDTSGAEDRGQIYDFTRGCIGIDVAAVEKQNNVTDQFIAAIAIMNAFGPDEVQRVTDAATAANLLSQGGHILYLTGQPRTPGLEAAKEAAMLVVCVGHRVAEEWGVRYLASRIRHGFPGLEVVEVYEEEVKTERAKNKETTS